MCVWELLPVATAQPTDTRDVMTIAKAILTGKPARPK